MVWHQEVLLPPHKDIFSLCTILIMEIRLLRLLSQGAPRRKSCPVLHIRLICGAPGVVLGLESVFGPDDLAFEICCEGWVVFGEACVESNQPLSIVRNCGRKSTLNTQISAHERLIHVNVLDIYLDFVYLTIRLLSALELAAGAKERRGVTWALLHYDVNKHTSSGPHNEAGSL